MKDIEKVYDFVKKSEKFYYDKLIGGKLNEQEIMNLLQASAYQRVRLFIEQTLNNESVDSEKNMKKDLQNKADGLRLCVKILGAEKIRDRGYLITYANCSGRHAGRERIVFAKNIEEAIFVIQHP